MASMEQLRGILHDIAKKENYISHKIDIKPITSEGANFTADLYIGTISEPLKPDIHIFAKAANLTEDARKNNEFFSRIYKIEALFYSEIAESFGRIYDKNQVAIGDRLNIPTYYSHNLLPYQEILVLENLEASGYQTFDRMKTFDWEYAAVAVTQMAKFHALGLSYRQEFGNESRDLIFDMSKDQDEMNKFTQQAVKSSCECLNEDYKQRLINFFSSKESMPNGMMKDKTMLIHGDFRPSNLMHRRHDGRLEIVLLDFQFMRMGNPAIDLIYFIFSGSDQEFRRLYYQSLLNHYFTQLTGALRHLHIDVENVYPRKTFDANMIEARPLGLMFGLTMAGMVMVAPEDAPKLTGDISSVLIKPNQLAQERIRGIVQDYVQWGIL
ncbi:uncharacterized protein LOC125229244 [Leguminivora glycinivorella]|uniref:uncharacterized protein LOC125229244 n=1 Tax=Leguminivora glycinivorella TaxID=1035111 RepID=UPI00200F2F87|nr:uncharacterized protein LOC125229244 [Leguminivora glycinivorella]